MVGLLVLALLSSLCFGGSTAMLSLQDGSLVTAAIILDGSWHTRSDPITPFASSTTEPLLIFNHTEDLLAAPSASINQLDVPALHNGDAEGAWAHLTSNSSSCASLSGAAAASIISFSGDGQTAAVGVPAGHRIHVMDWDPLTSCWLARGPAIILDEGANLLAVALSDQGHDIAMASVSASSAPGDGLLKVFHWQPSSSDWMLRGSAMPTCGDDQPQLMMTDDGEAVAIGERCLPLDTDMEDAVQLSLRVFAWDPAAGTGGAWREQCHRLNRVLTMIWTASCLLSMMVLQKMAKVLKWDVLWAAAAPMIMLVPLHAVLVVNMGREWRAQGLLGIS